jgi:DNA-binding PadR family transcriptional regulator
MWMDILILGHLSHGPAHGYEIKQRVGRSIGVTHLLNNAVLYPALRRFEEMGAVTSELVPQQGSPPRRVYHMTERGQDVLRGLLEDFPPGHATSEEFNVRVGYFHLLDPRARLEILQRRAIAVGKQLDHLGSALELIDDGTQTYAQRLVRFLIQQSEGELDFIEGLAEQERRNLQ